MKNMRIHILSFLLAALDVSGMLFSGLPLSEALLVDFYKTDFLRQLCFQIPKAVPRHAAKSTLLPSHASQQVIV
jgi:hypothetical protein